MADGPRIPLEVSRAQEEGRLVFFCGAGVSVPAGLPTFAGLVERLYEGLRTEPMGFEQEELRRGNYDRVLWLLEERFGRHELRQEIGKILATPDDLGTPADPRLATHRALLDLATDRKKQIRLVTTNFDGLFEAARPGVRVAAAPALPVPKPHKWNQLVHLHGKLDADDPEGTRLVLTPADFGVAYQLHGWASRFVVELFHHFTVLFVGYGVHDPVMRYLVDAITAERSAGGRFSRAYAIAETEPDKEAQTKARWCAKGIIPILYDRRDNHKRLHKTLVAWSEIWSGSLRSKLDLVADLAGRDPVGLCPDKISQLCWAVSEPSGAAALKLAELGKEAKLAWLDVFEKQGLLVGEPHPDAELRVALVDRGHTTRSLPPLDPVRRGIADWLTAHLDDPALARWAIDAGGRLHPRFLELVRERLVLSADETRLELRKVWRALSGSLPLRRAENENAWHDLCGRLGSESWSPTLRIEVLRALEPCVDTGARESFSATQLQVRGFARRDRSIAAELSLGCELSIGRRFSTMIGELRQRPDWQSELCDLAFELSGLLRRAVDLHVALGLAAVDEDPSYFEHPLIEPSDENRNSRGSASWVQLIDLVRDAFDALAERDPERGRALLGSWLAISYPLFRRLALYAGRCTDLIKPAALLATMKRDAERWIWSVETQVEFLRTLPRLWEGLAAEARSALVELLLQGPPRAMFAEGLLSEEWDYYRDCCIWERLVRLRDAGVSLRGAAADRLRQIEETRPDWRYTGEDREDLPFSSGQVFVITSDFSIEQLLAVDDEHLIEILTTHEHHREQPLQAWHGAVREEPARAIRILDRLREEGHLDAPLWSHSLAAFVGMGDDPGLREGVLRQLERLPESTMRDPSAVRSVAMVLPELTRGVTEENRARLLAVWDRAFAASLEVPRANRVGILSLIEIDLAHRTGDPPVSPAAMFNPDLTYHEAIKHPTGLLTEAALGILRSGGRERNAGIDEDVGTRLERVISTPGVASRLGRMIVASRLPLLHHLDPVWAKRHVVALLDWADPEEASTAWRGFLQSARAGPSLWEDIKRSFFETFNHLDQLDSVWPKVSVSPILAMAFAEVCMEWPDAIAPGKARHCLRKLDDCGRGHVVFRVRRMLEGAGARAPNLWRNRVQPWLELSWPRDRACRGPAATTSLAEAAMWAGDAFSEAAACVERLVEPIDSGGDQLLDSMLERGLVEAEPAACLGLADALAPEDPQGWLGQRLRGFLDRVGRAAPDLPDDPRFERLDLIALRLGA